MNKILIFAMALMLGACGGNRHRIATVTTDNNGTKVQTTTTTAVNHDANRNDYNNNNGNYGLDYNATYKGTFPAADGPGIETTLRLHKDGTFELKEKYIDRDTKYDLKGNYTVAGNILTLKDKRGDMYFQIEQNQLRRLDANRKPATGNMASHYVLTKS